MINMKTGKTSIAKLTRFNLSREKWLFSAILLIMGLFQIAEGFQTYSFVCNRIGNASDTCKISHFAIFETRVQQFPLSQLKEAKVEQSVKSKITVCYLVTEKEVLTFGSLSSNYVREKQEAASKINTFLQNPNQLSLSLKEPPGYSIIFSGILFTLGAFLLFFSKTQ